jgi:hypothetical protein
MQKIDHAPKVDATDNQHVDVASCTGRSACKRSVDEGGLNSIRQRRKCARDYSRRAGSLAQHSRDLFENRTGTVGTVQRLIAALLALQQPRLRQTIQLADHCA